MSGSPPVVTNDNNFYQQLTTIPPPPPPSSSSSSPIFNLSPNIIITLLVLSAVIIAATCLSLVFRHFRCLRGRHHLSTVSPATSLRHHPDPVNVVAAASSSIIDSLPLFTFSSIVRRRTATVDSDCAVCLSKFKPPDQLRLLPLCCHAFHAECIDAWLRTNQTCPLCRSNVVLAPDSDSLIGNGSFRLEIGSVSRRQAGSDDAPTVAYSIGSSFEYVVDGESEVVVVPNGHQSRSVSDKEESGPQPAVDPALVADVAAGRNWLGDYMDRLSTTISSGALSFRSSRRFFTGSSRRSEVTAAGEWDLDRDRVGEEISEWFRWASAV